MDIKQEYKLKEGTYFKDKYKKKQIIIGNTMDVGMEHFNSWSNKINGKYKKTATYTVLLNGIVYEHYNPLYYSNFLGSGEFDKNVISIVLENEGWFIKDFEIDKFVNWCGDTYKRDKTLFKRSWRGRVNWAPYSIKQMNSLIELCNKLIEDFKIKRFVSEDNLKISDFTKKRGIYYRSNYDKNKLDVSPAFDIDYFKNKIENNGKVK